MDELLNDSIEDFLSGHSDFRRVREIESEERGTMASALWDDLEASGFMDAVTSEEAGGAGLPLHVAAAIAFACGRHAVPQPMALTMVVRAAAASMAQTLPRGPITIAAAEPRRFADGGIRLAQVPFGKVAAYVVVERDGQANIWPVAQAQRVASAGPTSLYADLVWPSAPQEVIALPAENWRAIGAAIFAAQLAGAMERVASMTISYANDRVQFGKPIAKFQAIQQQVSVMAEHVAAARMSASIGLGGVDWRVDARAAAIAKAGASEVAGKVAAISHSVHGAIGVTEEFDLQLLTRRLREWSQDFGSACYWQECLGRELVAGSALPPDLVTGILRAPEKSL